MHRLRILEANVALDHLLLTSLRAVTIFLALAFITHTVENRFIGGVSFCAAVDKLTASVAYVTRAQTTTMYGTLV
jgi:hypothetical protein